MLEESRRHSSLLGSEPDQGGWRRRSPVQNDYLTRLPCTVATCLRSPADTQVRLVANLINVAGEYILEELYITEE